MSAECRSCHAPVVWVETEATAKKAGRRMPLDADPTKPEYARKAPYTFAAGAHVQEVPTGNIAFTGQTANGTPIVRYTPKRPGLAVSHFATCPFGPAHRRRGARARQ